MYFVNARHWENYRQSSQLHRYRIFGLREGSFRKLANHFNKGVFIVGRNGSITCIEQKAMLSFIRSCNMKCQIIQREEKLLF